MFAALGAFGVVVPVVLFAGMKLYTTLGPYRSKTCTGVTVEEVKSERDLGLGEPSRRRAVSRTKCGRVAVE
jgi:hypothetical protein